METTDSLANLSERQLLSHFGDLVRRDRVCTAELLAAVVEIDERKLWAKHACDSMFAFCVERCHMSESVTAKRIWAARTARRFPVILQMVSRGELHLSAVLKLAKHLTEDNHRSVLGRATHKSSREIDLLVAELHPKPDVPSRIRALPRSSGVGSQPEPAEVCTSQHRREAAADRSPAASVARRSRHPRQAVGCCPTVGSDVRTSLPPEQSVASSSPTPSDVPSTSRPTGRGRSPRPSSVQDRDHGGPADSRQVADAPGPTGPPAPRLGPGDHRVPCDRPATRRNTQEEGFHHRPAAPRQSTQQSANTQRPGRSPARGMEARPWSLRIRRSTGPPLPDHALRGIPSRKAVRERGAA